MKRLLIVVLSLALTWSSHELCAAGKKGGAVKVAASTKKPKGAKRGTTGISEAGDKQDDKPNAGAPAPGTAENADAAKGEEKPAAKAVEKPAVKTEAKPADSKAVAPAPKKSEVLVKPDGERVYKEAELDTLAESLLSEVELENLAVDARFDVSFLTGNGITQGFTLPSLRLSIWGDLSSLIGYRISFGQTREFTSVFLPQIIPVEGFIELGSTGSHREETRLALRLGMFTPSLNPWWTPDLSDLPIPSYSVTHQEIYLSRDLGIELKYESPSRAIEAAVGAFNGVGVFSQNTNNSKAGNIYLKGSVPVGDYRLYAGVSLYGRIQSNEGNVNYRRDWVGTAFVGAKSKFGVLQGEYFIGEFESSTTMARPSGGAAVGIFNLSEQLKFFSRYELLRTPPSGGTGNLVSFQLGPMLQLHSSLVVFGTYTQRKEADGSPTIHIGEVRFRLNV